ncbi:hypothetical protein NDU88_002021 [Pleurodeles waltl]|uniref:HMCN n=1 Tax=Pleurodeles waltl TaxID=8319 RepID=A0AAV7R9P3_PLEWA|nr:hypothetical protein NDU88_002021 [Pleurodeles waltl]
MLKFQLTILEPFTADLNDKTSEKYINYKTTFETQLSDSYKTFLNGFVSVNVTGFSAGSVIVEYVVIADRPTESSLDAANANIVNNLSKDFTFPASPFLRIIVDQTNFTTSPEILFQGDNLTLTCRTRSISTSVSWTRNGVPVKISAVNTNKDNVSESVLIIPSITTSQAGEYSCSLNDATSIYLASRNVSVSSINPTFNGNKDILCDGNKIEVYQWCTNGNISFLTCGCTPSGGLTITGKITTGINCQTFEVQADIASCPQQMSGKNTNYRCQCSREGRELISNTTTVTFIRKAIVTIIGNRTMSEYGSLSLKCSSDVPVYESMTWTLERKAGGSPDLQKYIGDKNETLNMQNVLQYWEGTYTCTVSQRITNSSSSATITILPLPSASQLTTNIVEGIYTCPSTVSLRCSTTDSNKYRFQFKVQGSSTPMVIRPHLILLRCPLMRILTGLDVMPI